MFLGVVHRLDKPVSGVLLFARTSKAAARLSEQFREGMVEKVYWAVVEDTRPKTAGCPWATADTGSLEDWLEEGRAEGPRGGGAEGHARGAVRPAACSWSAAGTTG